MNSTNSWTDIDFNLVVIGRAIEKVISHQPLIVRVVHHPLLYSIQIWPKVLGDLDIYRE